MKKFTRSRSNRVIFGVCGGIGNYFNIDPVIIRIIVLLLGISSLGGISLLYLLVALIIPNEPYNTPREYVKKEFYKNSRQTQTDKDIKEAEKVDD